MVPAPVTFTVPLLVTGPEMVEFPVPPKPRAPLLEMVPLRVWLAELLKLSVPALVMSPA